MSIEEAVMDFTTGGLSSIHHDTHDGSLNTPPQPCHMFSVAPGENQLGLLPSDLYSRKIFTATKERKS